MSEPEAVYGVPPDVLLAGIDTGLASWVQYMALRCRELALELEVEAGHLALSGLADNTDGLVSVRDAAQRLAERSTAIVRGLRAGKAVRR